MVPLDYVLAVAVLVAPLDSTDPIPLAEHACLMRAMREVAQGWEILDRREHNYVLLRADDFAADAHLLRKRYHELADAPPVSDAGRFPSRELACELLTFNRAYHRGLSVRRDSFGERDALCEALREADELYRLWDLVRDARSECYYVSVRRGALLALRQALGDVDYHRGVMPPHVPVWRFERRD
ncbi:MAG: hypothetical protein U0736_08450 [Gemmataceae bacterium]